MITNYIPVLLSRGGKSQLHHRLTHFLLLIFRVKCLRRSRVTPFPVPLALRGRGHRVLPEQAASVAGCWEPARLGARRLSWHGAWFGFSFSLGAFMICLAEKASNAVFCIRSVGLKKPNLGLAAAVCQCNPQFPPTLVFHREVLLLPVMREINVRII